MFFNFQKMIKESTEKNVKPPLINKNLKKLKGELSPRTIKRNISNDNFLKFQWAWTL
tara:strand:+ start:80 stop:250 length:171 start_codon:yes stop_codon:yes gene_type:complete